MTIQYFRAKICKKERNILQNLFSVGQDFRDAHIANNVNYFDVDEWDATYGHVYKTLIDNGLDAIMGGHIMMREYMKSVRPDIKDEELQIVCGAHNVREGLKVIVAKVGAVLPGDFEIKKSKIRGEESCGMICALFELGLEEKTEENYNKGIHELGEDAVVGNDPIQYLGMDDTLYDLDIHKHRNNDCYYHIGFAYEIACILNKKVTLPELSYKGKTFQPLLYPLQRLPFPTLLLHFGYRVSQYAHLDV